MHLDPGAGLTERFVTIPDGRKLRTVVAGEGPGPLVVFEAGMSAPAATWSHTQHAISAHTRTLSYDRAGYGGSDEDPADRTLERIVDDLTALLEAIDEVDPVILVGHSWGGPIVRLFADRHPDRVAGLVFVDATLAEAMPPHNARITAWSMRLMGLLARFGAQRLIERTSLPHGFGPEITDERARIMLRDYACHQAMRTGAREAKHIGAANPTMRRLQEKGTPPVPTISVQGGRVDRGMSKLRPLLNQKAAVLTTTLPSRTAKWSWSTAPGTPSRRRNPARSTTPSSKWSTRPAAARRGKPPGVDHRPAHRAR